MARNYHRRLALAVALMSALLAVQAFDLQRSLLPPELAGLSAAELLAAVTADPDCTFANPTDATVRKETACAGCTVVKTCVYAGSIGWIAGKNSSCSGGTPWCNDGACSATPSPTLNCNSAKADDTFQCPSNGYWPNLASCNKYWMCTSAGAFAGDCSGYNNAVYDPLTTLCVPKSQVTCSTISCKNAPAYQVVPSAPWLYAVCTSDNLADAVVLKCENQNQRYNGTNCVNACNQAGRFPLWAPDSAAGAAGADTGSYFECVANGNELIGPTVGKCPGKGTFDSATSRCTFT
ncbi:hypothetical protein FOCC_FOCC011555 [Frankliniella occidentalis]|uniref:Uncharacterized protein LOC113206195 n=1 Tax=Frankliniella occidentalis TaxID=133901 RepID=A0A6J1SF48_FRAOC|nr:uncharacterized protein LOC113206195 [Frankliniella occidentalis]KAE8742817.1 hypothetical protein FOCC_FOCC011555 [Frankliniella occidentalis]